jgi:hypothetical protein
MERGFGQEKFPNEPILEIIKSLSIKNKCKKTIFRLAKSKPNLPLWAASARYQDLRASHVLS